MVPPLMIGAGAEVAWDALDEWLEDLPPDGRAQAARVVQDKGGRHLAALGPWEWAALVGATGGRVCEVGVAWSPQHRWQFTCSCGKPEVPCGHVMATALLAMLPPAIVVVLMQKWFVKGLVDTEK